MTYLAEMHEEHLDVLARLGLARPPFEPVKWVWRIFVPPPALALPRKEASQKRRATCQRWEDERSEFMAWKLRPGAQIILEVAQKHGVTVAEIKSRQRNRRVVMARHEAFYRCSKEMGLSLPVVGRICGGFDHTTVLHGVRKHTALLAGQVYIKPGKYFLAVNNGAGAVSSMPVNQVGGIENT